MFEYFIKGGFLMYPIAVCSFFGLAIIINKFLEYRKLYQILEQPLEEIIKNKPDIIKPIIKAIYDGLSEKEISIIGTKQVRLMERGLSWLALISTIAPLLGLTGTVTGMIKAFMVISQNNSVNPSMLAGGIWEALITTAFGLLVAIPIHVGHHYLEKQLDEIVFLLKEISLSIFTKRNKEK
ncbi:MAG: MotA/TolQ/ExbB proton channel family protein [Proteobacteria bacterium]|nr:MotA/TolQ/ExbB proton channel family protein [Pseudomonadota bacterium]